MQRGKHRRRKPVKPDEVIAPSQASSLPSKGAVPHLPDGVTAEASWCSTCGAIGPDSPHLIGCAMYRPPRLEFTVGVCVRFKLEGDAYVMDGKPDLTDGGLFSDATEGPWAPDVDDWIGTDDPVVATASAEAFRYVNALTGLEVRP